VNWSADIANLTKNKLLDGVNSGLGLIHTNGEEDVLDCSPLGQVLEQLQPSMFMANGNDDDGFYFA
jgi:hypothetical protein